MSTCKTASPPPPHFFEDESSNFNTMFLATTPREVTKDFSNICLYVEKIDLERGPR